MSSFVYSYIFDHICVCTYLPLFLTLFRKSNVPSTSIRLLCGRTLTEKLRSTQFRAPKMCFPLVTGVAIVVQLKKTSCSHSLGCRVCLTQSLKLDLARRLPCIKCKFGKRLFVCMLDQSTIRTGRSTFFGRPKSKFGELCLSWSSPLVSRIVFKKNTLN